MVSLSPRFDRLIRNTISVFMEIHIGHGDLKSCF